MNKIFQIGFNKCGTCSINDLFEYYTQGVIKSIHWDFGKLALSMHDKLYKNTLLLDDYIDTIFFSDMECLLYNNSQYTFQFMFKYFKILDQQYPNSKFILNTRDINNWIISRLNHSIEYRISNNVPECIPKEPYYNIYMKSFGYKKISDVIHAWENEWLEHHNNVIEYFKNRPDDLLIFNIEKDSIDKIINFFPTIQFYITYFPHSNKTNVDNSG